MGRLLYVWLVGLHPRHFRELFGGEMLGIYDEAWGNRTRGALFIDVLISLFRQWVLRPGYREPALSTALAGRSSHAPLFHMLDSSLPRRSALVSGRLLPDDSCARHPGCGSRLDHFPLGNHHRSGGPPKPGLEP